MMYESRIEVREFGGGGDFGCDERVKKLVGAGLWGMYNLLAQQLYPVKNLVISLLRCRGWLRVS
jgi:hypothetical protein